MKTRCPHCDARLVVRDDKKGMMGRCPQCQKRLKLVPESEESEAESSDSVHVPLFDERDAAFDALDSEFANVASEIPAELPVRRKKSKSAGRTNGPEQPAGSSRNDDEDPADDSAAGGGSGSRPRRRRGLSLVRGVWDFPFYRSSLEHWLKMSLSLAFVGGLVGFLMDLCRSRIVAGLIAQLVASPVLMISYLMLCYPASCFVKVLSSSAEGADEVDEWPESSWGVWGFDMVFVTYVLVLSIVASMGLAKVQDAAARLKNPAAATDSEFWRLFADEEEESTISIPGKLTPNQQGAEIKVKSTRPVLRPGKAWYTVFGAFLVLFPVLMLSCLDDSNSSIWVPVSASVVSSLVRSAPAWFVVLLSSACLATLIVAVVLWGTPRSAFLTLTLLSPAASAGVLIYARLLGRLGARTAEGR